jgi:hypothetical protein
MPKNRLKIYTYMNKHLLLSLLPMSLHAQPSSQPAREKPWTVAIVPAIVASTDSGVGGGVQMNLYDHRRPIQPYAAQYEVVFTATSKREQTYSLFVDKPQILGGSYRIRAGLSFERTPRSQFFGFGNDSERDPLLDDARFYEYDRSELSADLSLRKRLREEEWSFVGQLTAKRFLFRSLEDSFFAQEQAFGSEGGFFTELGAGFLRDDRDQETWPVQGGFDEFSLRGATFAGEPYLGGNLTLRRYFPLAWATVLSTRLAADVIVGDAPFFVQERFGLDGISAIGGGSSVRGFPRARFIGKKKMLTGAELRYLPWSTKLFGLSLDLGGAAFVDLGKVFDLPESKIHAGAGLGFRLIYEKDFVVRIDLAHSNEDLTRVYLDVGHPF